MTRQTILIAGATGNIGKAAALALAKRGAHIVLLGRHAEKLQAKINQIQAELQKAEVDMPLAAIDSLVIDFTDMDSVRHAAAEALERFPQIDALVLSVGVFLQDGPTVLPNGYEVMFATNVVGPFLLVELLKNTLEQADGLVVQVIAPFKKDIDWNDLQNIKNHKPMTAYNRTKVLNRMFAAELARRNATKFTTVAFDPAFVIDKTDPELAARWPSGLMGFFWRVMTILFAKPPAIAGEPIAELILEHEDRHSLNGALYKLGKRINPDDAMNDVTSGKRLWNELKSLAAL